MALKLQQSGIQPLGQFDGFDAEVTAGLGGEVCTFTYVAFPGTDEAAADIDDGYVAQANTRPAVSTTLTSGDRPLFLCDDGTSDYGTLFGQIVGANVGVQSVGGTVLGPHTATGSGKVTLWDKPGIYAVTLDAVDTTLNSGLVPTNPVLAGGDALYATTAGLLTPDATASFEASLILGRFIEFTGDGSLVTSTLDLVQATNSPVGATAPGATFTQAVFHWYPEL